MQKLQDSEIVVLDEGSQFHKYYIEAFDWLLQDIIGNKELPFGGKHVIIRSDLGQTLPIVEKQVKPLNLGCQSRDLIYGQNFNSTD